MAGELLREFPRLQRCRLSGSLQEWRRLAAFAVVTLDQMDRSAFSLSDADILKAALLLADKYRSSIDYPIAWQESAAWQQAMFADWLVNYARTRNLGQPDLGEYVTDRNKVLKASAASYAFPATGEERKTIRVLFGASGPPLAGMCCRGRPSPLPAMTAVRPPSM